MFVIFPGSVWNFECLEGGLPTPSPDIRQNQYRQNNHYPSLERHLVKQTIEEILLSNKMSSVTGFSSIHIAYMHLMK